MNHHEREMIKVLERRLEFISKRILDLDKVLNPPKALSWDKSEKEALEWAIEKLKDL